MLSVGEPESGVMANGEVEDINMMFIVKDNTDGNVEIVNQEELNDTHVAESATDNKLI